MKNIAIISSVIIFSIFNIYCNKPEKSNNSHGLSASLNVKYVEDYLGQRHIITINISNDSLRTIGIPINGRIRRKVDTTSSEMASNDCIIEIIQNGLLKRSTDFDNLGRVFLRHDIPFIWQIKKGGPASFRLYYIGNLRNDFSLSDVDFLIRVVIVPSVRNISIIKDFFVPDFDKKYNNVNIITDTIKTPFIKVD